MESPTSSPLDSLPASPLVSPTLSPERSLTGVPPGYHRFPTHAAAPAITGTLPDPKRFSPAASLDGISAVVPGGARRRHPRWYPQIVHLDARYRCAPGYHRFLPSALSSASTRTLTNPKEEQGKIKKYY